MPAPGEDVSRIDVCLWRERSKHRRDEPLETGIRRGPSPYAMSTHLEIIEMRKIETSETRETPHTHLFLTKPSRWPGLSRTCFVGACEHCSTRGESSDAQSCIGPVLWEGTQRMAPANRNCQCFASASASASASMRAGLCSSQHEYLSMYQPVRHDMIMISTETIIEIAMRKRPGPHHRVV
jgi:hypothetical protein